MKTIKFSKGHLSDGIFNSEKKWTCYESSHTWNKLKKAIQRSSQHKAKKGWSCKAEQKPADKHTQKKRRLQKLHNATSWRCSYQARKTRDYVRQQQRGDFQGGGSLGLCEYLTQKKNHKVPRHFLFCQWQVPHTDTKAILLQPDSMWLRRKNRPRWWQSALVLIGQGSG